MASREIPVVMLDLHDRKVFDTLIMHLDIENKVKEAKQLAGQRGLEFEGKLPGKLRDKLIKRAIRYNTVRHQWLFDKDQIDNFDQHELAFFIDVLNMVLNDDGCSDSDSDSDDNDDDDDDSVVNTGNKLNADDEKEKPWESLFENIKKTAGDGSQQEPRAFTDAQLLKVIKHLIDMTEISYLRAYERAFTQGPPKLKKRLLKTELYDQHCHLPISDFIQNLAADGVTTIRQVQHMFDNWEPRELTTEEKATWEEIAPTKLPTMTDILAERLDTIGVVYAESDLPIGNYQRRFMLAKGNQDRWKEEVKKKLKDKILLNLKHKLKTIQSVYFDIFQSPHIYGAPRSHIHVILNLRDGVVNVLMLLRVIYRSKFTKPRQREGDPECDHERRS
jgi:hypothetical protein